MKLIASGVTFSAAMQRSPSFSRSSSSTRITIFPARISASAASTDATAAWMSVGLRRTGSLVGALDIGGQDLPSKPREAQWIGRARPGTTGAVASYQRPLGVSNGGVPRGDEGLGCSAPEVPHHALHELVLGDGELGAEAVAGVDVAVEQADELA